MLISGAQIISTPGRGSGSGGSGVTSVGLADSTGLFTITGSPVTSTGTLTLSAFAPQTQNTFLAAPNGSTGAPTFRTIVAGDVPSLPASIITSGQLALARGGTNADLSGTGGTSQVLRQSSVGATITVGQIAASDLSNGVTGSGVVVLAGSPALTGSPTSTTQATSDNSTKIATTAFVATAITNAVAGINPAVAVQAATAAILPNTPTYLNGVGGIGATITAGATNTTLVVDGYTPLLNDRILVKNEASGGGLGAGKNGVYFVSQLASLGLAWILTRALDYDQPSDINNTGAIPVINGTVNTTTQWVLSSSIAAVDGTQALTYAQFSANPATLAPLASPTFTGTVSTAALTASGLISAQAGVTIGVANTTAGVITLEGGTSGACTITAPAVAGTIGNPIAFSNGINIPSATAHSWNNDTFLSRQASGTISVGAVLNGSSGTFSAANFSTAGGTGCILGFNIMSKYNGDTTQGNGIASIVFSSKTASLTANFNAGSAQTVYSPAAGVVLRINWSQSIVTAATSSSTFPSLTLGWTDVGGVARTQTLVATSTTNTTAVTSNGSTIIYCNATAVTVTSASYASSGGTVMAYALAISAERLA